MIIGIDASLACREERTGVESYAFYIISHLASVIPPDVEVRLYSDRAFPQDFIQHIPQHWKQIILSWPPRFLWTQVRLSFELLLHPPDIFFTPGHVEPILHPECTVMMVHDVAAWRIPRAYSWFNRVYTLQKTLNAYATNPIMLVPTVFTKEELEKLAQERNVHKKTEVVVVPHGFIPFADSTREYSDILKKFSLSPSQHYILSIGRVEYKKNIDTIIRAFEQLKNSSPAFGKLKLVLAGKPGYGYEPIQKMIENSRYKDYIIQTGWVTEVERFALLKHAQSLIFVSRYEGFGFPVLEALSLGIPVIASKGLGLEEVGGGLCTFVSSDDEGEIMNAIGACAHMDTAAREVLQKEGQHHVHMFSWSTSATLTYNALVRAYQKLQ